MAIPLTSLDHALRKRVEAAIRKEDGQRIKNRVAPTTSHMEQNPCDEPLAEKKVEGFTTRCRVHFHSVRKRLADSDGISGKACLDGLVHAGILSNDSTKEVQSTTHSQEKGEKELTVITITAIE